MINNYYTLQALATEWRTDMVGSAVREAFSQQADELTLALERDGQAWMLRTSVQAPFLFAFRTDGFSKARRNVATLFQAAAGRHIADVRTAERDRLLYLDFEEGGYVVLQLFGSRANVFHVDEAGGIVEAFRADEKHRGRPAPVPRPAPMPETLEAFEARWRPRRNHVRQAVSSAFPLFDRMLAEEVIARAGVHAVDPDACMEAERAALFQAGRALADELEHPQPRIFWRTDGFPEAFSLVELQDAPAGEVEPFQNVDAAVRVFAKRRLARARYAALYEPVEQALTEAAEHYRGSLERMMDELSRPSRAERYERWGHLLMAQAADVPAGREEVRLPDLFGEEDEVVIPLDPARTAIENAERYYDRARRTRRSREEAETRMVEAEERAEEAEELLDALRAVGSLRELERFRKDEAERLAPFLREPGDDIRRVPFRRFELGGGYEVWVGRNARQNDELTFHHAQKYDLWMHARGVPGSHTVLRLPNRDAEPGKRRIHQAAAIAAHFSKARGSALVPVMVARRKHVRSPKGGAPGAVYVEHEEVVMVEPGLPRGRG